MRPTLAYTLLRLLLFFAVALVLALFGRRWLSVIRRRAQSAAAAPIDAFEGVTPPPAGPDEQ